MTKLVEDFKKAQEKAQQIIAHFQTGGDQTPDAIEARRAILATMKKDELVEHILALEAPKDKVQGKGVAVLVKDLLCAPECALLNYEAVATLVRQTIPDAHTTSKTVSSLASKQGADWGIVPRIKPDLSNLASLIGAEAEAEPSTN